jgi:hypothetical protein
VDDVMVTLKLESLQDLDGEPSNQPCGNTLEVVLFDELVQVHAQDLKGEKQMLPEDGVVQHPDDIVLIILVLLL